jgi:hypothetical protein
MPVKAGALAQKLSPGPNRLKVIVPVGLKPEMVAVSWIAAPTAAPADAVVLMTVMTLDTVTDSDSSLQFVGPTGPLLASPL